MRLRHVLRAAIASSLIASSASADPANVVMADSLFQEGRALLEAGRVAEACAKLEESQRLDPGGGTLLNLAICHEREGRLATAHAELESALAVAIRDNRGDREAIARARIGELAPRVPHVLVDAPSEPGLEIHLDARPLPPAAWSARLAIDPGDHVLDARSPGRAPRSIRFRVAEGAFERIRVPVAESPDATPAAAVDAPRASGGDGHTQRTVGVVGVIVGGVAAVGGLVGWYANQIQHLSNTTSDLASCKTSCDDVRAAENERKAEADRVAVTVGLVGVGIALAGTIAIVTAPRATPNRPSASLVVGPASMGVVGTF